MNEYESLNLTKWEHSHPPDFEKKVLGWRFGPATRQG